MPVPEDIARIRAAIYGEDVRGSIADAIQEMYNQIIFDGVAFDSFYIDGTSLIVNTRVVN